MKTILKGLVQLIGELAVVTLLLPLSAPLATWIMSFDTVAKIYYSILTVFDNIIGLFM